MPRNSKPPAPSPVGFVGVVSVVVVGVGVVLAGVNWV